jgi:alpha-tubulin suppressor-like RCC1 family protein
VRTDGTVACWGDDSVGQATPPAGAFVSVTSGPDHNCGMRANGTVACWGANGIGEATPPAGFG